MDGSSAELVAPVIGEISAKLSAMMKSGISIQKENSVTAFASTAVVIKEAFDVHFKETIDLLLNILQENAGPEYKQYRAQIIEAITLISSAVSDEAFLPESKRIAEAMIFIQAGQLEAHDPQRSYLLSAW